MLRCAGHAGHACLAFEHSSELDRTRFVSLFQINIDLQTAWATVRARPALLVLPVLVLSALLVGGSLGLQAAVRRADRKAQSQVSNPHEKVLVLACICAIQCLEHWTLLQASVCTNCPQVEDDALEVMIKVSACL